MTDAPERRRGPTSPHALARGVCAGGVALVLVATVCVLAFAGLPRPARSSLIGAGVAGSLLDARLVRAVGTLDGHRFSGRCLSNPSIVKPRGRGIDELAATLSPRGRMPMRVRRVLAGCSSVLYGEIVSFLRIWRPLRATHTRIDGRRVTGLRMTEPGLDVTLFVAGNGRPVAVAAASSSSSGRALLSLQRRRLGSAEASAQADASNPTDRRVGAPQLRR